MNKHLPPKEQLKEFQMEHSRSLAEMTWLFQKRDRNEESRDLLGLGPITESKFNEFDNTLSKEVDLFMKLYHFGEMLSAVAPTTRSPITPLNPELRKGVYGEELYRAFESKDDLANQRFVPIAKLINTVVVFMRRKEVSGHRDNNTSPQMKHMHANVVKEFSSELIKITGEKTEFSEEKMRIITNFEKAINEYFEIVKQPKVAEFLFGKNAGIALER